MHKSCCNEIKQECCDRIPSIYYEFEGRMIEDALGRGDNLYCMPYPIGLEHDDMDWFIEKAKVYHDKCCYVSKMSKEDFVNEMVKEHNKMRESIINEMKIGYTRMLNNCIDFLGSDFVKAEVNFKEHKK